ncbi:winged helix-turn-helix transcriptional regulator [Lachnospiraceae bacterium SGI.085]
MIKETPQREIATELGIAQGTVNWFIKRIHKKTEQYR